MPTQCLSSAHAMFFSGAMLQARILALGVQCIDLVFSTWRTLAYAWRILAHGRLFDGRTLAPVFNVLYAG